MNLSNIIEAYIKEILGDDSYVELKRNDIATHFNCVPSQINYVIATRFVPELGFYVESRRGGGGYIKINRVNVDKNEYIMQIFEKMGSKLSQSVAYIYLENLLSYNILDENTINIIKVAVSDKTLAGVAPNIRDNVRADIFKSLIVNCI